MAGFVGRRGERRVGAGGSRGVSTTNIRSVLGSARDTGTVLSNLDFVLNLEMTC